MARKLVDLEKFMQLVRRTSLYDENEVQEITINRLKYLIAQEYGISDFVQKGMLESLVRYGFIKEISAGTFQIIPKKKDIEKIEQMAKDEVDKHFQKIKGDQNK